MTETLKAGRELDALVAEKVMGMPKVRIDAFLDIPFKNLRIPAYSTDISAAWEVVERLSGFDTDRDQPWWAVAVFNAQKGQIACVVYACSPGSLITDASKVIAEDIASTAPEAICRAALKVIG